ncbi:TetR/AcrR family transcriptional regulator [Luteolibacter pohnpeiensis]|uniref:TetR/AcrR family transcriptional regulator n=1 Tax=Luteolibacter pohnpeiensis TaxID=454153 RepID=A0A934VWC8_9BACT|nr:TetR/AcrR family transcriptional regulator [Luteolibacter pohnpeiensis]MBK1884482.1 TetR/AcrR family transcriptional regulator [Luteolibacter pohnpeiensis]
MDESKSKHSTERLRSLAEAAITLFCRQGYERSQVADVAKLMGVAVGTVYLYVAGKEALFDLAVRHASSADADWLESVEIPLPNPEPGATLAFLRELFDRAEWPKLMAALACEKADDPAAELDGVIREQYRLMRQNRRGLLMLARSALEFPGLAEVFVLGLRAKLLDHLSRYLALRVKAGQVRQSIDLPATVAVMTQSITWANLQRPFDPGLIALSEEAIENSTVELLVRGVISSK